MTAISKIARLETSPYKKYPAKLAGYLIMGRDPVERAKRAKYKPPAMRVRGVCYTKKSPFRYNFGCSSLNYNERKGDFNGQQGK